MPEWIVVFREKVSELIQNQQLELRARDFYGFCALVNYRAIEIEGE